MEVIVALVAFGFIAVVISVAASSQNALARHNTTKRPVQVSREDDRKAVIRREIDVMWQHIKAGRWKTTRDLLMGLAILHLIIIATRWEEMGWRRASFQTAVDQASRDILAEAEGLKRSFVYKELHQVAPHIIKDHITWPYWLRSMACNIRNQPMPELRTFYIDEFFEVWEANNLHNIVRPLDPGLAQ